MEDKVVEALVCWYNFEATDTFIAPDALNSVTFGEKTYAIISNAIAAVKVFNYKEAILLIRKVSEISIRQPLKTR